MSNPPKRSFRVTDFLSLHLAHPSTTHYHLPPSSIQALRLSLFSHLLEALPSCSHLLPRSVAPSNQHAVKYYQRHGCSLPRAQKAAMAMQDSGSGSGTQGADTPSDGSDELGPEYGRDRLGMPCGHVFKEGEPIYRCRDCGLDDTCVQCVTCFNASDHTDHDIMFSVSSQGGGCCDCGDEEAWVQKVKCRFHDVMDGNLVDAVVEPSTSTSTSDPTAMDLSTGFDLETTTVTAQASAKGKSPEVPTSPKASSDRLSHLLSSVPQSLSSTFSAEVQSWIEFVLRVVEHAPDSMELPHGYEALEILKRLKSIEEIEREEAEEEKRRVELGDAMDSETEGEGETEEEEQERLWKELNQIEALKRTRSFVPQFDHGEYVDMYGNVREGDGSLANELRPSQHLAMYHNSDDDDDDNEGERERSQEPGLASTSQQHSNLMNFGSAPEAFRAEVRAVKKKWAADAQSQATASTALNTLEQRYWSVVLWNDEKHSFSEVIDTLVDASDGEVDEKEAKRMAERVDKHGREIVKTSTELRKLYRLAGRINHIDLAVTIRPSYDVFAEEVAGHVLDFLLDISSSVLFLPDPQSSSTSVHPNDGFIPNASALRALIMQVLLRSWDHNNPSVVHSGRMEYQYFRHDDLRNLDGFLLMDAKMWKEARATCREIWLMIMGAKEVKKEIAIRFAEMYPKMMEIFILRDREQEHSVCYMTVQLFSVPSIAEYLASKGFLEKVLDILTAVFTGHLDKTHLILPPERTGPAKPQNMPLRQQRCYHSFSDLRYLLQSPGVQSLIVNSEQHLLLRRFIDFLRLFNAITPDRRASATHVEYETEFWITVFHVSSQLGKTARLFGEAFKKASSLQWSQAVYSIVEQTIEESELLELRDPNVHPPLKLHSVNYSAEEYLVVDFSVARDPVSFHHPMHWFAAELMKHLNLLESPTPKSEVQSNDQRPLNTLLPMLSEGYLPVKQRLIFLDFPLRVTVKLAQIRVGLWVRNGYGLRSQAHHYRDNSMREIMSDQDLYLLQCGFLLVDPTLFLVTILDRFALLDHFVYPSDQVCPYDPTQKLAMLDELYLFLISLISEVSVAASWSVEQQVRREIIQFLALGRVKYSDLIKNISERLTDHASFDRSLTQLANFRPPDGTTGVGIFELREEYYDEVNPFFYHYTKNQREKAEEVLSERRKKSTGQAGITIPKKLNIPKGPFKSVLPGVLTNVTLLSIIYNALETISRDETQNSESVIDSALHLLMLGLVEDDPVTRATFLENVSSWVFHPQRGSKLRTEQPDGSDAVTLLRLLIEIEDSRPVKMFKTKIAWIIEKIIENDIIVYGQSKTLIKVVVAEHRCSGASSTQEQSAKSRAEETRKAAAKARQDAIMKSFSQQHANLLASFDDDDEDDEESEEQAGMEGLSDESSETKTAPPRKLALGSCILCQENLDGTKAFGSLAHVQPSRILRITPRQSASYLQQSLNTPLTLDNGSSDGKRIRGDEDEASIFPPQAHRAGFFASTCGHLMHLECFHTYCRSVEQRQAQQIARNHPENLSKSEFICPLCKSLGNVILPVPGADTQSSSSSQILTDYQSIEMNDAPVGEWIRKINIDILKGSVPSPFFQESGTGAFTSWFVESQYSAFQNDQWNWVAEWMDGPTLQMIARLLRVLNPLSAEIMVDRKAFKKISILAPPSTNLYLPEDLLSYTVSVLEVSQRGLPLNLSNAGSDPLSATVADSIPDQTIQLLRSLLHCLRTLAVLDMNGEGINPLKQALFIRLLPQWGANDSVKSPLLLRNPLTILMEAAVLVPESIRQVTTLMYYATLVQAVFGLAQPSLWPQAHLHSHNHESRSSAAFNAQQSDSIDSEAAKAIFPDVRWTVANIIGFVGYARGNITLGIDNLDDATLAKLLCSYTLPFLRRASIVHRIVGGALDFCGKSPSLEHNGASEYSRLLQILKISPPSEGLPIRAEQQTPISSLVEGWIKHGYAPLTALFQPLPLNRSLILSQTENGSPFGSSEIPTLLLEHPHIYELVPLPKDLATLIQRSQSRRCRNCNNVPPSPALCLLCGELLCYQSYCCEDQEAKRGECNMHMLRCGGAVGLFYRVKSNVLFLLHQDNGTFTESPYLDSHGETDTGLRKGRPQKLELQRYDELRKQWLNHGIANVVARRIESLMDQGGWTTF